VVELVCPFLSTIQHASAPSRAEVTAFTLADPDSLNPGVLHPDGSRLSPLYSMHVNDCIYADVLEFLPKSVLASAAGLFSPKF